MQTAEAQDMTVEAQEQEPVFATRRTGPTIATALRQPAAVAFIGRLSFLNPDPLREIVEVTETLKCWYTSREKEKISDAMSRTFMEITAMEEELALLKKKYKNQIETKQVEHKELAQKHYAGFEMREVDCHLIRDYRENTVRLIRLDTWEVVDVRPMTAAERQRGLGL
jgi:hypothetical protein